MGHSKEKESQNCSAQGLAISCCISAAVSCRPVKSAHSLGVRLRPWSRAWMFPPGERKQGETRPKAAAKQRLTCQHEGADAAGAALHGGLHQRREAVAVPALQVQAGEVAEQVAGDEHVTCRPHT